MLQTIKKNISVIPAVPAHVAEGSQQTKLLRVAAYCRVSTLQEQQESSYEAQVNHYREKIQNHPGWKLAGIYADDGEKCHQYQKTSGFSGDDRGLYGRKNRYGTDKVHQPLCQKYGGCPD